MMPRRKHSLREYTIRTRETSIVEYTVRATSEDDAADRFHRGEVTQGITIETPDVEIESVKRDG
jgi:hypothetical protein